MEELNKEYHRPWGHYKTVNIGEGYKVKHIFVKPGKRLSLQSHKHRSEHWTIVKGSTKVRIGDDYHVVSKNMSVYIPKGSKHRIDNTEFSKVVELIETQVGDYLGEDDITRYEDDYGRAKM